MAQHVRTTEHRKKMVATYEKRAENAIDEELNNKRETEQQRTKRKYKRLGDKIRKLKLHRPDSFMIATPASLAWDTAVEIVAKAADAGEDIANAIDKGIKYIKNTDWYKSLSDDKKQQAEKDFTDAHLAIIAKTPEEKKIDRLEKQLEDLKNGIKKNKDSTELNPTDEQAQKIKSLEDDISDLKIKKQLSELRAKYEDKEKRDNKFTSEEAKDIWSYIKRKYTSNGVSLSDAIADTAKDIGLTHEQVANAIVTPKTKPLLNSVWKAQRELTQQREAVNNWIDSKAQDPAIKLAKNIFNLPRKISTWGHFAVFSITHARKALMNPKYTAEVIRSYLDSWKAGIGKPHVYERMIRNLENDPLYKIAADAGLQNNPRNWRENIGNDLSTESGETINKKESKWQWFSKSGERAFNGAIKPLRQNLFNIEYENLTENQRQDKQILKDLAEDINNKTGAGKNLFDKAGKLTEVANAVVFSPKLEQSRWRTVVGEPAKLAATTISYLGKHSTEAQRVWAVRWIKNTATVYATTLLSSAITRALTNYFDKDKRDHTDFEWNDLLKAKLYKIRIGSWTIDQSGGVISAIAFTQELFHDAFADKKEVKGARGDAMLRAFGDYAEGKLSPQATIIKEIATKHDYDGNSVPWASDKDKPYKDAHKAGWLEYISSKLPLPAAEASKTFYNEAKGAGATDGQIKAVFKAGLELVISGMTGISVHENTENTENESKKQEESRHLSYSY